MKNIIFNGIIDLVYPERCVYCDEIIKNGSICKDCEDMLTELERNTKTKSSVYYVYKYDYDYITTIVMALKRTGDKKLAEFMADKMCSVVKDVIPDISEYTFTFVPRKLSNRLVYGVDQSEILASLCAGKLGAKFRSLLNRKHFTKEQKALVRRNERIKNVKGIFKVKNVPPCDFPRKIILIDDVTTTGSTINQAAIVLKNYLKDSDIHVEKLTFSATTF